MSCGCGIQIYTEAPSGGVRVGGSALVDSNRRYPSGGVVCGGTATVSTSSTWDTFDAVYHLIEQGNGTAGEYLNSTGHVGGQAGDGTTSANFPTSIQTGIFYYGNDFDGNDYITCPKDTMNDVTPVTVSLWANIEVSFMDRVFFSRGYTEPLNGYGWQIQLGHTIYNTAFAAVNVIGEDNWIVYKAIGTSALTLGCWYHLAAVFTPGASLKLYVDGVLEKTTALTETSLAPTTKGHYIGRLNNQKYTDGTIQEVRMSPVVRSADWLASEAANLCDRTFYNQSSEQNPVYS